jgi:hypothetical protein
MGDLPGSWTHRETGSNCGSRRGIPEGPRRVEIGERRQKRYDTERKYAIMFSL